MMSSRPVRQSRRDDGQEPSGEAGTRVFWPRAVQLTQQEGSMTKEAERGGDPK